MKTIIFFFIVLVVGCSSRENIVSVRQVQNDSPVILRIRKDRTAIHSLLYPIAFEFKKNGNREIYYFENSYYAKNENICPGTAGCYLRVGDKDRYLTYSYRKFDGKIKYVIDKNIPILNILNPANMITDAFYSDTIPIYFGSANITDFFNSAAFINVADFDSLESVVEKVKELDQDDEKYLKIPPSPESLRLMYEHIEESLRSLTWLKDAKCPIVGLGGSIRSLGKVCQKRSVYPLKILHMTYTHPRDIRQ